MTSILVNSFLLARELSFGLMKNATFRQLRVFCEVAKELSMTRAAEKLHLSTPAVTMQVRELEGHLGISLFERQGRKISLTTTGEYMLVYARRILASAKDAEDMVSRLKKTEVGVLTIGMVSTAKYFMMMLLAQFQHRHPGVELRLALGNREVLGNMLRDGEVDIAVMGRPPKDLPVRSEPFAAHPLAFVASPDHILARREQTLTTEDLRSQAFIVREPGSGTRAAMEQYFSDARVSYTPALQVTSNETVKQAVMAGLGLGFLSLHTLDHEWRTQRIAMLDVQGTPIVRAWNVVHAQSKLLSTMAESFRYFMLEHGESYMSRRYGSLWGVEEPDQQPGAAAT